MNEIGLSPRVTDRLTQWLELEAGTARPEHLDEVLASLEDVRQRPGWSSPGRWLPMQLTMSRSEAPRLLTILAILGLILAVAAATLFVASRPRPLPPPFGLAATGSLVLDAGGQLIRIDPADGSSGLFGSLPDRQYGATWSRDGLNVAFWVTTDDPVDNGSATPATLWVADADGASAQPILGDRTFPTYELLPAVSWSPDGAQVAFSTSDGDLFVVDADGSNLHEIGDESVVRCCAAWSPDGQTIAFNVGGDSALAPSGQASRDCSGLLGPALLGVLCTVYRSYSAGLHIVNPDGSGEVAVETAGVAHPSADWSPDGSALLYTADGGTVAVARRDGSSWQESTVIGLNMRGEALFPRWSNTGDRFAYVRANNLLVSDGDGSNTRVVSTGGAISEAAPCWSPDDRTLVAFRHDTPDPSVGFGESAVALIVDVEAGQVIAEVPVPGISGTLSCSFQRQPLD